jgi:hypothetical protein
MREPKRKPGAPSVGTEVEPAEGDPSAARDDRPAPARDPGADPERPERDPTEGRGVGTEVDDGSGSSHGEES